MSPDEAQKVAAVVADVDGGCVVCVSSAMCRLMEAFPEHDWPVLIVNGGWDDYGRGRDSALEVLRDRLENA